MSLVRCVCVSAGPGLPHRIARIVRPRRVRPARHFVAAALHRIWAILKFNFSTPSNQEKMSDTNTYIVISNTISRLSTIGDPAYVVCLRHTAKEEKRTAKLSPCVCTRQITHGNERHGEQPMPCAIRKTHGELFAVCCRRPHGIVKHLTPPRRRRRSGVGRKCSLP
jgi:hypothetical protein